MHHQNQTNCKYPDLGIFISPQGRVGPCGAVLKENLKVFNSIDQLETDPVFQETKNYNIQNNILGCSFCAHCKELEDMGVASMRQRNTENLKPFLSIAFSNTCNLDCVMCGSEYSSKWYSVYKNNREVNEFYGPDSPGSILPHSLTQDQVDEVCKLIPRLDGIIIKGGEPLVDPMVLYFLEKIVNIKPDININMVSNFTVLNLELLSKFKNLNLMVSVDGIGKVYEWIRGTDFGNVDNNLTKFANRGGRVRVQPTLSAYNVEHMQHLYEYYNDKNIKVIDTPFIDTKYFTNANHIGEKRFHDATSQYTFSFSMQWKQQEQNAINMFERYTQIMNKHRGFDWHALSKAR